MVDVFGGCSDTRRGRPGPPGPPGKRGFDGSPGEKGSKGDKGPEGLKGDRGDDGPKGEEGEKGDVGAKGERGDVGARGEKGDVGPKGEEGERGNVGAKGERGDVGARGEKGDVGPPGKRGKRGDSALDIAKWMPTFILNEFRKSEESCCFMIRDLDKDLEKDERGYYTTWISRNDKKNNAKAVRGASKKLRVIKSGEIWGLDFNNSSYVIQNASLRSGFACITYQLNHARGDSEQVLFMDNNRGVSTNGKRMTIYGVDNESNKYSFQYSTPINTWDTMFVQWLPNKGDKGIYVINSKASSGYFACNANFIASGTITLGGSTKNDSLKGSIAAFESYTGHDERVPNRIWRLIFNAQQLL